MVTLSQHAEDSSCLQQGASSITTAYATAAKFANLATLNPTTVVYTTTTAYAIAAKVTVLATLSPAASAFIFTAGFLFAAEAITHKVLDILLGSISLGFPPVSKADNLPGNICLMDSRVCSIFHPLNNSILRRPHRRRLRNVPSTSAYLRNSQRSCFLS